MKTQAKKGILIIAVGHPNYGHMAQNLAASIKYSAPDIPIALVHSDDSLRYIKPQHLNTLFDYLIKCPEKYTMNKGNREWIKAKVHMYDLTPFSETIFIDADNIMLPQMNINKMFAKMESKTLEFSNRGCKDLFKEKVPDNYSIWCNVNDIKKAYKVRSGKWFQLHSEFIYFEKTPKNKKFFDTAIKVYEGIKIKHKIFGGGIPDELPFGISCILNKTYPSLVNFTPIYWEVAERRALIGRDMMAEGYYAYSTGGSNHSNQMKNFYNNLVKFYANNMGVQHPYKLKDKVSWAAERSNL